VTDRFPFQDFISADRAERRQPALDLDIQFELQPFPRQRTGGNAQGGLARGGSPTAPVIPETIFFPVRVIGVTWTKLPLDVLVVAGTGVCVLDKQANGRTGRPALEDARQNLHIVRFLALRSVPAFSGSAPFQLRLDLVGANLQPRRKPIDDATDRGAMALAEGADPQQVSERVM
jgi:hypothetical protein